MSKLMRPFVIPEKPLTVEDQNSFLLFPMFIESSEDQVLDFILQKRKCKSEIIHSGHFMVSQIDEQQDDNNDTVNQEPDFNQLETSLAHAHIRQIESIKGNKFNISVKNNSPLGFIEEGLSKLFECMSLAYSGTITSPKWKTFKGLPLKLKDKIRLNNIIWRAWHIQYINERDPRVCKFSSLVDYDAHRKPESVVLEGKYWKRRPSTIIFEYHKWRLYYKQTKNALPTQMESTFDSQNGHWFDWTQNQVTNNPLSLDDDFVMDFTDNLFNFFGPPNIIDFPNPREIARSGMGADFIQPGLTQLQPPVDDFVETFTDFLSSKVSVLPTLQEETAFDNTENEGDKLSNKVKKCESSASLNGEFIPIFNQMLDLSQENSRNESYSNQNHLTQESGQLTSNILRLEEKVANLEQMMRPNTHSLTSNLSDKGSSQTSAISRLSSLESPSLLVKNNHLSKNVPFSTQNEITVLSDLKNQMIEPHQQYSNYDCELRMAPNSVTTYSTIEPSKLEEPIFEQDSQKVSNDSSIQFLIPKLINKTRTRSKSISSPEMNLAEQPVVASMSEISSSKANDLVIERSNSLPVYSNRLNQVGSMLNTQLVPKNLMIFSPAHNQSSRSTLYSSGCVTPTPSTLTFSNSSISSDSSLMVEQQMNYHNFYNSDSNLIAQLLSSNRSPQNIRIKSFDKLNEIGSTSYQSLQFCPSNYSNHLETVNFNCPNEVSNGSNASKNILVSPLVKLNESNSMINSSSLTRKTISPPLNTSQFSPASKDSSSTTPIPSPQSLAHSPSTSKNYKLKTDQERLQYKEHRRVCHINAEQKRRCNIKNGFDTLRTLLPSVSQNMNTKISKAAMLQKAADYIRAMKIERQQQQEEYESLKQQIEHLNQTIGVFQNQLPATGAPISCKRTSQIREKYDIYIKERTLSNWKFWIFSMTVIESLLESYLSSVTTIDIDDMCQSVLRWLDQNCSLVTLRKDVLDSLRYLSTSTSILANPALLPQEIEAISKQSKNKIPR